MIPFSGRITFKKLTPLKPLKWAIKLFHLANSPIAYILDAKIYDSKSHDANKFTISDLVIDFVNRYEGSFRNLFCYRFYCSIELVEKLERKGIFYTGTMNTNRKSLLDIVKLKKDEILYY